MSEHVIQNRETMSHVGVCESRAHPVVKSIHLQHMCKAVAFAHWNFLLFLGLKLIKNSSRQMRQLYVYVPNDFTRHLKLFVNPRLVL